jgi:predicted MFS family arabinose efflux permease
LFVPVGIALLAGTPLAVWLTPHVGWVYAALTIISVLSVLLAFIALHRKSGSSLRLIKSMSKA